MAEIQRDTSGSREDTLRFLDMVSLFGGQAMIALGKVMNPATGKAEKNLPAARLFIDTLEMLERKTAGNLNGDETKLLKATLTDLRMMYVEEVQTPAPAAPPSDPQPPATPAESDSKVKFHKSYE